MIKIFLVLLMAAAAESKETVLEQGTEVIIQEEGVEGSECTYDNAEWSECDPLKMLRTKSVQLRKGLGQDSCPTSRILTKDCLREELGEGTLKLLEENNKLKTEVNQLNYENQQLRESLVQQANGVSNTTEDSTGRSAAAAAAFAADDEQVSRLWRLHLVYRELLFRVSFLLRQSRFRMGEFMILYSRLRSKYQVVLNGGNSYAFQELLHSFDEKCQIGLLRLRSEFKAQTKQLELSEARANRLAQNGSDKMEPTAMAGSSMDDSRCNEELLSARSKLAKVQATAEMLSKKSLACQEIIESMDLANDQVPVNNYEEDPIYQTRLEETHRELEQRGSMLAMAEARVQKLVEQKITFQQMLTRINEKLGMARLHLGTFLVVHSALKDNFLSLEAGFKKCKARKDLYEALLLKARVDIGQFLHKTNYLQGGYNRILSKYRGRNYLTYSRYESIAKDLQRTHRELGNVRTATVQLIGAYRICTSHSHRLESESKQCFEYLRVRTEALDECRKHANILPTSLQQYELSCQNKLAATTERMQDLHQFYRRFILGIKHQTMQVSIVKLGLYVKQTIASYKKLQAMHSTCRQKIGSCKSLLEEQLDKFNAPQSSSDVLRPYDESCPNLLNVCEANATECSRSNMRKTLTIVHLTKQMKQMEARMQNMGYNDKPFYYNEDMLEVDALVGSDVGRNSNQSLCNHLSSKTRLLKVVLANLVLRNANLSQEVWVLRRLLHQYELATSQDLLALMKWFVGQLNLPIGNATGGEVTPGGHIGVEVSGSLSSILGRSRVGTLGPDARKVLGVIESQVNWLRNFVESNRQSMTQKAEWNNKQLQQAMTRLSNQTLAIERRLEEQNRKSVFGVRHVSYSEYEILQHQKEELELQNKRLVERISKLKYILKTASHQKNFKLHSVFRMLRQELENLGTKTNIIIERFQELRNRQNTYKSYGSRIRSLVDPVQEAIRKVIASVHLKSYLKDNDRLRLHSLSVELGQGPYIGEERPSASSPASALVSGPASRPPSPSLGRMPLERGPPGLQLYKQPKPLPGRRMDKSVKELAPPEVSIRQAETYGTMKSYTAALTDPRNGVDTKNSGGSVGPGAK